MRLLCSQCLYGIVFCRLQIGVKSKKKAPKTVVGVSYIPVSTDNYNYDTYGNQLSHVSHVEGEEQRTHYSYTTDGNYLASTYDDFGNTTQYHYNSNTGVLEWVQYPNDTTSTRTNYTYDSVYRLSETTVTTNQGKTLSVAYTFTDDRLMGLETNSTAYNFTYNAFGDRTSVKIGTRSLATYTYTDDKNRYLSRLDYGNNDSVQYTYDDEGRVTKEQYENGYTITYAYDSTGALVKVNDSATNAIRYYYDDLGRVGKLKESGINGTHTIAYTYNDLGAVIGIKESLGSASYVTQYAYDGARRTIGISAGGTSETYAYDEHGRLYEWYTHHNGSRIMRKSIVYDTPDDRTTSNRPIVWNYDALVSGGYNGAYSYTYDANGNIKTETVNGKTTTYTYDSANQLIREDNQAEGKSWVWTYDDAGNILSKREYVYTTGTLGSVRSTIYYGYGNAEWGDLLTTYNGTPITYDTVGNPLSDGTWNYTWIHGRKLVTMYKNGTTCSFSYDANGMRNRRTVMTSNGTTTYNYTYSGSQLTHMAVGGYTLHFYYDANGYPMSVVYNGTTYYYATNLQGDVVAILNSSGVQVVGYRYDAWGRLLTTTGSMSGSLGYHNPLRYRGYVYDHETQLYYLQSRYYNPAMGRFINADGQLDSGDVLGLNLFAYCGNNPVNRVDPTGEAWWHWVLGTVAAVAAVAATVATLGALAPAAACTLTFMGTSIGLSYATASTLATIAVTGTTFAASMYAADAAYSAVTGSSFMLNSVFQGNVGAYNAGQQLTALATFGMINMAAMSPGVCFVAGTLVKTESGNVPIESIKTGDMVWAWNEETGDVALKEVVETYVRESNELIHVFVEGEEIITTPTHPFYSPVKGWTEACKLRAGDILVLVNGEYVVIEKVQHEILETPIAVYNFQVEGYHTYYVANSGVLVHNMCAKKRDIQQVNQAAKEAGIPDRYRPAFGDYVENSKWGFPKNYTYSYNELIELAQEFKELVVKWD